MTKIDKLTMFFKEDNNAKNFYKKELSDYKNTLSERGSKYYPNFAFWLEHISNSYYILKEAISFAEYKYNRSDSVWLKAIKIMAEQGKRYELNN